MQVAPKRVLNKKMHGGNSSDEDSYKDTSRFLLKVTTRGKPSATRLYYIRAVKVDYEKTHSNH